ncbi:MAG: hypothetical protein ABIS51_17085 [Sphingomonas sp.]
MKASYLGVVLISGLALGGCHKAPFSTDPKPHHGRYTGIGIYSADKMWSEIARADKSKDKAAATTADDQNVIVVVDGDTGEIRQCGNLSGYCVGMNPWSGALAKSQTAPLGLSRHAAELSNPSEVTNATEEVDNVAEAAPAKP